MAGGVFAFGLIGACVRVFMCAHFFATQRKLAKVVHCQDKGSDFPQRRFRPWSILIRVCNYLYNTMVHVYHGWWHIARTLECHLG